MKKYNANTLEFWLDVKKDYENGYSSSVYLCDCSTSFRIIWNKEWFDIQELANKFLIEMKLNEKICTRGHRFLFLSKRGYYIEYNLETQLRINFINWNIERLKPILKNE